MTMGYHHAPVPSSFADPTFTGTVTVPTGGPGNPGVRVTGDPDTGLAQFASDSLSVIAGGTEWLRVGGVSNGCRSGQFQFQDGSAAAPGLRVGTSSITGLFSNGDNSVRVSTLGHQRAAITQDGAVALSGGPGTEALRTVPVSGAINRWQATGAPAGTAVVLESAGADADVRAVIRSKGSGGVQLEKAGGALGFFGAVPSVKPTVTGSRGDGSAAASLLAALAALGLVTDATTP
ncbi:hypothetical protein [Azospirillum halopraeferens]|uniref:hypothetical protein n=1 Tax=Azospirillum halopraeferens TaxID=34010 RepID=UPI00040D5532|nr:hypothetical protein [Azospirillum halopraeferens]